MKTKILLPLFCALCASAFIGSNVTFAAPPRLASAPKAAAMVAAPRQSAVISPPKPHGIILVWQSEYAGQTNVETIVDSATGSILGAFHEKTRLTASQQSWTNTACTNGVEFFKLRSVITGAP